MSRSEPTAAVHNKRLVYRPHMAETVFAKIIRGEIPCHKVSDESSAAIGRALPRIARAVLAATGATAYNLLQNNGSGAHQAVMHVHFHIIPKYVDTGLGIVWKPGKLGDEAAALASAIAAKTS
jgi:diadenosine tetraphosphate (Ap4A) HIT family hydrolase